MGLIGLVLNESSSLGFGVKVQNHQLRLLCAVARPNSTHLKQTKVSQNPKNDGWEESHQLCWRGSNPPDDASWPSGLKCHKVADEITCRSQVHIITFELSFWCIILIIIIGHFSPVLTSQSLTVPSSLLVTTNFELNWRQVTADWCLLGPDNNHHKSMKSMIFENKVWEKTKVYLTASEGTGRWGCPRSWLWSRRCPRPRCCLATPSQRSSSGHVKESTFVTINSLLRPLSPDGP